MKLPAYQQISTSQFAFFSNIVIILSYFLLKNILRTQQVLYRCSRGYHALSNADSNTNVRKLNRECGRVDICRFIRQLALSNVILCGNFIV